ncbi:mycofactocin precursor MftA [Nocardia sp. NPDC052278]
MRDEKGIVHESDLVIADGLAAEVSIDGMCGVY